VLIKVIAGLALASNMIFASPDSQVILTTGQAVLATAYGKTSLGKVLQIYADGTADIEFQKATYVFNEFAGYRATTSRFRISSLEVEVPHWTNTHGETFRPNDIAVTNGRPSNIRKIFHKGTAIFLGANEEDIRSSSIGSGNLEYATVIPTVSQIVIADDLVIEKAKSVLATANGKTSLGKVLQVYADGTADIEVHKATYVFNEFAGYRATTSRFPISSLEVEVPHWTNTQGEIFRPNDLAAIKGTHFQNIRKIFHKGTAVFSTVNEEDIRSSSIGSIRLENAILIPAVGGMAIAIGEKMCSGAYK